MIPGLQNFRLGMQMGEGVAESASKPDTSEQIYISSLALLKMLKHCRAGVPL
jgi:26S proteasome regulatory subunit N11